jgi:hypothetical protein
MAFWFEEAIAEKLKEAGNHVILVPAQNPNAPLDTVDIYNGETGQFIAADVPEDPAREFAIIWNELVENGENTEKARKLNFSWLSDFSEKRQYNS